MRAFERDLEEKDWVILLRDPATQQLAGFSTQMLLEADVAGRTVRTLFSGDTIIDRAHWGDNTLPHVWGRFAVAGTSVSRRRVVLVFDFQRLSHLSLSAVIFSGVLSSLRSAHPRKPYPGRARRAGRREISSGLRSARRRCSWRRCARTTTHPFAEIPARHRTDPHVNYFLEKNPGYIRGDELCCLAPLTRENFTAAGLRVIHRAQRSENMP